MDYTPVVEQIIELVEKNPKKTEDFKSFNKAVLDNTDMLKILAGVMSHVTLKWALAQVGGVSSQEETLELVKTSTINRAVMELMYMGVLIGKNVGAAESMEKMFSDSDSDSGVDKNFSV